MRKSTWDMLVITALSTIVLSVFILVTILLVSDKMYKSETYTEEFSHSFNIYALEDNTSYILSRYSSESVERYHYMRKLNGGYKSGRIPSSDSYIYETTEQPKIEVYYKKVDQEWVNIIFGKFGILEEIYKIYVPENSVKYDFNVDLK